MARIYEYPDSEHIAGAATYLDNTARAGRRGRLSILIPAVLVLAAALFGWAYYRSGDVTRSSLAALVGLAAVAAVYLLIKAFRRENRPEDTLGKLPLATPDRRVELVLEQLDDRFAVFRGVKAGTVSLDHLIVGPTGVFTVVDFAGPSEGGASLDEADARAMRECDAVRDLLRGLLPQAQPDIQPVVCIAPGAGRVERDARGVWVVPTDKLAAGLIKRSGQDGAIALNVNETGAFSSDALQSAAVEHVLAKHWSVPTRKTIADYLPPAT